MSKSMNGRSRLELSVGSFMVVGILCLVYLSINLGNLALWQRPGYEVFATFSDVGGLRSGSAVMIAGVEIGSVKSVQLDDYMARITLHLDPGLHIYEDAIVSVKTRGLIGEKFIQISAGAADEIIKPGGRIRQTESAVDLESLISKFAFGEL